MLREPVAALNCNCHRHRFLNSSTGECVQVDIPELHDHKVLAPTAEGLLLLLHARKNVRLLNPLTGQLIKLPPLTTLLPKKYHHWLSARNHHFDADFTASGSGIADDDSTVVLCFYTLRMLGVAKPSDQSWTLLKFNDLLRTAPVMFAARFHCITLDGVMVLEMDPPRLVLAAKRHMWISLDGSAHLVDNGGELMLVHRKLLTGYRRGYDVYRVDLGTKTLFPVNSLGGGCALFMGMYCSLSVPIEGFPSGSISGDNIYLSFDVDERDGIEAYHLVDKSISPSAIF
ncbi:uncharacterized protein [Lolium perenne]|uniref:uncharacterized protein n=1 Tax=Lolium perenne TaxID=4522 RepID=UPI0021F582EF|nr:uncharacterized protein LOC127340476 [Lolium perenne]